jgi:hypothetical protein
MKNKLMRISLLLLAAAPIAAAQSATPTITAGDLIPLTLKSDIRTENMLSGSMEVGTTYDDNVLFGSSNRIGAWSFVFRPRMRLERSSKRFSVTFHASPWVVVFQNVSQRDQFTGDSGFDATYRFTPHLSMKMREAFVYTDHVAFGPESGDTGETTTTGTTNLLDPTNDLILIPFARRISSLTDIGLTYLLSPSSDVQVSGDFYLLRLRNENVGTSVPFVNTEASGGRALYNYHFSPRIASGFMYDFQDYSFEQDRSSRNIVHTFFYVQALQLTKRQSLEGFAGPQYSEATNSGTTGAGGGTGSPFPPGTSDTWTWAGGLAYGWQGVNTKLRASVLHDIGAGEGVLGSVERTEGTIELRRQLTTSWVGSAGVGYEKNQSLFTTSDIGSLGSFFANAGITYKLGEAWRFDARYYRNQQSRTGVVNTALAGNRDQIEFTVGYQIRRPLGR